MKYQQLVLPVCLYFCWFGFSFGQVQQNAVPYSVTEKLAAITHFVDLDITDSSFCKSNPKPDQRLTPYLRFACPIHTDFDPSNSGQWTETSSGSVWRLGIRSQKAYSLYIHLRYFLAQGARMYVYSPDYQDMRGAFTSRNNSAAEVLSIAPVRGDRLIIELNVPVSQHSFGEIKITKVYHDYFNIFKETSLPGLKSTMDCDEDINCANGRYWQTEKRAVCKIISDGGMGTGTLIGNISGSNTPYVLTAYHLISSAEMAAGAIFLFNYESTGCKKNMSTIVQNLSGASLLSITDHRLDFVLMKLWEIPPRSYRTFYAGWDARNTTARKGVCIHHPYGNSKQIALEYHTLVSEDIGMGFDTNSTWKVSHWELGYTGPGSSGAPLFNEQHRIIGTLTGGRSTCDYPRDDYFTKFGVAWDAFPDSSNQLKYWFDPAQTGQLVSEGYDPYGFNEVFCDTAWNFSVHDRLGLINAGLAWGWTSGHSAAGFTEFAERFESPGLLHIAGLYLYVAKAYSSNPLAHIELKIWEGNRFPENECYSEIIFIKDLLPDKINYVAFDTVLRKSGPFFAGYKINYLVVSDTFALYQTLDRGYGAASSMYLYKDSWYQVNNPVAFGISASLGIGISECYGKSRKPSSNVLQVYPNPCSNSVKLDMPAGISVHNVKCFDINGRPVSVALTQDEDGNTLYFNLKTGIYYLKIVTEETPYFARFVVLE